METLAGGSCPHNSSRSPKMHFHALMLTHVLLARGDSWDASVIYQGALPLMQTTRRCFRSHFRFMSSQRYALEHRYSKKPEHVGDVGSESRWFCPGVRVRKGITIVLSLFWSHWLAVVYCWSFVAALVNRYTKTEPGRNSYIRFSLPSSQRNSQVRKSGKDEIPRQQRPVPL